MTDPTVAYGALSYWHDTAPMRAASRRIEPGAWFDVAILGAGYTGLWTAHHLLERDPSLQVALIEKEEVGFGASGRNGGFAMTKIGHSLHQMTRDHGVEQTLAVHEAAEGAVQGLAATVDREGIDCELRYGGLLTVATNDAQARKLGRELDAVDRLGLKTIRAMGGEEVQASVHSPTYRMALSEEHCAVLHPAKLARGLADSVVRKGAALFERAGSATLVDEGNRVRVDTVSGPIYAKQAVIATNAWTARNPAFSRWLIPMYTYIIATEPLSEATWAEIGWDGSEGIEDKRVHLHYYRRTLDGRILWGGRDNTATFNNAIGTRYDRNEHIFGLLQASFAATFPQLSDVRFTHAWGGPIALTPDFLPRFGSTSARVHYGFGYCGHGVGPSYLGGEILRDLACGEETERTGLLFVRKHGGRYPVEPIRYVGAQLTRKESLWYDEGGDAGKDLTREPRLLRLATKLFSR